MARNTSVNEMLDLLETPTCPPDRGWTTGNIAEAFPGVFQRFGASFVFRPMETAFRKLFVDLGVFPASEVSIPHDASDCFWSIFSGRGAGNIDKFVEIGNVMPGTSATAIEAQLFGNPRPETVDDNTLARVPIILAKAPNWMFGAPKRHDAMFDELRTWRLAELKRIPTLDEAGCNALITDSRNRFEQMMTLHMGVAMVASSLAEKVTEFAVEAGHGDLQAPLLSGVGSDENEVAQDLWNLAHGTLELSVFLERHGYHGPNEGQLHARVWRDDPAPVLSRLEDYRDIPTGSPRAPEQRTASQVEANRAALETLLSTTSRAKRPIVERLVRTAGRFLALREQGKAGYLLTFDVGRAAARQLGALLVDRHVIDEVDDVFHLSVDELQAGVSNDQRDFVAEQAAAHTRREQLRLPKAWSGQPEIETVELATSDALAIGATVDGIAASPGVHEGIARVVHDPGTTDVEPGDVLVCETTDPSWVALFMVAGAVVTDHGGMLSHGPIVAREMGIPCVAGTGDGSARIQTGQTVRVNGDTGSVEIVA